MQLTPKAEGYARALFARRGQTAPTDAEVSMAVEKLLEEAHRHSADPTSNLLTPISAAFG